MFAGKLRNFPTNIAALTPILSLDYRARGNAVKSSLRLTFLPHRGMIQFTCGAFLPLFFC